jgi:rhamnogalacturonyl hydrolase YesR
MSNGGSATSGSGGTGAGGAGHDSRDAHFDDWPAGADPATVGTLVAQVFRSENVAGSKHYKIACAWYGSLSVSSVLGEQSMVGSLIAKYDPYQDTYATLLAGQGHVDQNVFGIVPLEISMHRAEPSYLQEGLSIADHQQANIESQKRFAIDDMFMITALQVQAFRASQDAKYVELAASMMVEYLDRLQQDDGLFHHHEDFHHKWARGNGWFAAGMAELIRELPEQHQNYAAVREGYESMMSGLLGYQIADGDGAGLWKQVVDSDDPRNWPETSGSAMFTYALVSGVRRGWLDPDTYGPAARAGWLALVAKLTTGGRIQDVSDWAYKPESHEGGPSYAGDEENYYFERPRLTGDNHGQAPVLWSTAALARPLRE